MGEKKIAIYEPDRTVKQGYITLWKENFQDLKENLWLIRQFFFREFKGQYSQSLLGIIWAFILPLVTLAIFILLRSSGLFNVGVIEVPYVIYALLGLSFWQLFVTGIVQSTNSLVSAGSMIKKVNFPRETLVFASLGNALFSFALQMGIVFILFGIYGFFPHWKFLLFPLMIIPILLLTCGLGFIFSLINGIIRDLGRILGLGLTFLLFITPIAYELPEMGFLATLARINPLYYLSIAPRDLALTGTLSHPLGYFISCGLSIFVFFYCWMTFHLTETRIPERL
ncbi:ABC transporter permease [Candidatus Borrarchaeum sp.]|uniref:ABC transporter permease n=1 Tax=Candidatus Borrarchaeum sp. TaxID=2846742 RepID=UPI00257D9F70|nr:ABC transporter permease [Candidatus Borrarchaeum sp.]